MIMILSACFLSAKSRVFEHLLSLFKTISNSGNSFCYLQSPLNCAAWLIKQHHCNAWPENQPWTLKYKLKTDLTHVLSVISHSCNLCGYSTTSASKLKRHMLWFTEANPAWLWDFLKHEIEKGLRAVQFTLERSLLFANSATSPAHQLGASRYTCSYTREGNPMLAHNAASHVHKLMTSKNTCSPIQERSLLFTQPFGCSQCNNTHTTPQNLKMHNAHPFIQEKGISDVSSATILAIVLVISRITSPRTLEKNSLPVSNATTLAVTQIVWCATCFHTLARNLLPESTAPRHLQTFKSFEEAYGKAWCCVTSPMSLVRIKFYFRHIKYLE